MTKGDEKHTLKGGRSPIKVTVKLSPPTKSDGTMSEPFVREFARTSCNGVKISCSDGAQYVADLRDNFLDIAGLKHL